MPVYSIRLPAELREALEPGRRYRWPTGGQPHAKDPDGLGSGQGPAAGPVRSGKEESRPGPDGPAREPWETTVEKREAVRLRPGDVVLYGNHRRMKDHTRQWWGEVERVTADGGTPIVGLRENTGTRRAGAAAVGGAAVGPDQRGHERSAVALGDLLECVRRAPAGADLRST